MRIFKYLKPYWFLTLMAPLTMLGEVVMDLLQPQLMSQIINIGLGGNNTEFILKTGLLMLLLVVLII
jgi:ATP-binding cassette subfamily B protein